MVRPTILATLSSYQWSYPGIRCLRIDQNSKGESAAKRFRTDPDILVLLLHGEKENAGLNVTCASRVFLLESVVHHGFEIQGWGFWPLPSAIHSCLPSAIARIDRMGQTRPTEGVTSPFLLLFSSFTNHSLVYCYYTEGQLKRHYASCTSANFMGYRHRRKEYPRSCCASRIIAVYQRKLQGDCRYIIIRCRNWKQSRRFSVEEA